MERTKIDFNDRLGLEDGTEGLDHNNYLSFQMIGGEEAYSFCDGVSIILHRKVPKKIDDYVYGAPKTEFLKTFDSGIIKEGVRILIKEIVSKYEIKDWNRISPPNRLEKPNLFMHYA